MRRTESTLGTKVGLALGVLALAASSAAIAGPRDQAFRLHSRLAGVPPSPQVLDQLEALIKMNQWAAAANVAMANPYFYNLTLKNWVAPWTNKDQSVRVGLNDYGATVIGMIRDDVPFDQVLSGDILYTGKAGLPNVPPYAPNNNDHYAALEAQNVDLLANLEKKSQVGLTGIAEVAGVLTTRGWGSAYYFDGTNRAAVRFSLMTYLCNDLEQLADTTVPDFRVRRDVDRAPGGDSSVFRNKCVGCHAGQDGFGGAFAHYDFVNEAVTYDATKVMDKMNKNATTFADGYVVTDDGWVNMWRTGQNARIGWNGDASGNGATSYGRMVTSTDEFPVCMAKRVASLVCLVPLKDVKTADVMAAAQEFRSDDYNMKNLFARTAATCAGE
jgi:hypothetical protein